MSYRVVYISSSPLHPSSHNPPIELNVPTLLSYQVWQGKCSLQQRPLTLPSGLYMVHTSIPPTQITLSTHSLNLSYPPPLLSNHTLSASYPPPLSTPPPPLPPARRHGASVGSEAHLRGAEGRPGLRRDLRLARIQPRRPCCLPLRQVREHTPLVVTSRSSYNIYSTIL